MEILKYLLAKKPYVRDFFQYHFENYHKKHHDSIVILARLTKLFRAQLLIL